jgi:hypothetical protein
MDGLPSPQDIVVRVLVWLGAPGLIVTIYISVFALFGWISLGKATARKFARTQQQIVGRSSKRQRGTVSFIAASAIFVAITYSLTQLIGVTYEKIGHHLSIAEGLTFNGRYLLSELIGYQHWTRLSAWAVFAALISIFLLNVADLIDMPGLRQFITFIWAIVLIPGAFATLLLALDGISVLILGLLHQDNYQPSMAILYLLWVACLLSLPALGGKIVADSKRMFPD